MTMLQSSLTARTDAETARTDAKPSLDASSLGIDCLNSEALITAVFAESAVPATDPVVTKNAPFANLECRMTPFWKRVIDVSAAVVLLIVLSPIFVLIAVYIRVISRGPVLFTQPRLGLMGEEFTIYKFRTLKCSETATEEHREFVAKLSDNDGVLTKPNMKSRAISGGEFLRRTSLDELPQLVNILQGNMSMVGPRPDVLEWQDYKPAQLRRFEVVPGVTGLWQVSGKNRLTFEQMIEKDLQYVENRSLWLDLSILLRTFRLLIRRDNE